MNGFYHSYPDAPTGIAAGREFVRLATSGEFANDGRHTTKIIYTTLGGIAAVYPGEPGAGAFSATPPALTVNEDKLYSEIEQEGNKLVAAAEARAKGKPSALAFDPTPWLALILAVLDAIRRRRNPTP